MYCYSGPIINVTLEDLLRARSSCLRDMPVLQVHMNLVEWSTHLTNRFIAELVKPYISYTSTAPPPHHDGDDESYQVRAILMSKSSLERTIQLIWLASNSFIFLPHPGWALLSSSFHNTIPPKKKKIPSDAARQHTCKFFLSDAARLDTWGGKDLLKHVSIPLT